MKWILIWISLNNHSLHTSTEMGRFNSMVECFDAREQLVQKVGKPIINYQAICVAYDKEKLFENGKVMPNK